MFRLAGSVTPEYRPVWNADRPCQPLCSLFGVSQMQLEGVGVTQEGGPRGRVVSGGHCEGRMWGASSDSQWVESRAAETKAGP